MRGLGDINRTIQSGIKEHEEWHQRGVVVGMGAGGSLVKERPTWNYSNSCLSDCLTLKLVESKIEVQEHTYALTPPTDHVFSLCKMALQICQVHFFVVGRRKSHPTAHSVASCLFFWVWHLLCLEWGVLKCNLQARVRRKRKEGQGRKENKERNEWKKKRQLEKELWMWRKEESLCLLSHQCSVSHSCLHRILTHQTQTANHRSELFSSGLHTLLTNPLSLQTYCSRKVALLKCL